MIKRNPWLILVIILIGWYASTHMPSPSPTPPPSAEEIARKQEASDEFDARVWTKVLIEERLKAPSTAKWQSPADFIVEKAKAKKDTWVVYGYVDAQNSFGAMLRTQFWATIKKINNTWMIINLETR